MPITTALGKRLATIHGEIIEIIFEGKYRPGSEGNAEAARMREEAESIIAAESPAGVLFNLVRLKYVWGDSICGLAYTIFDKHKLLAKPACVLAQGPTFKALEPLFKTGWAFAICSMRLFDSETEATRFLEERLEADAV